MRRLLLIILLSLCAPTLWAQNGWADFVEAYVSRHADNDMKATEALLSEWEEIHRSPFNLNTVSRDELLLLPFMDEATVDSLLSYRTKHKGFTDLSELLFVWRIGYDARRFLPLFLTCTPLPKVPPSWREMLWKGNNTLETKVDIPLYRRAGESETTAPEHRYLGNGWRHHLKFQHNWPDRLSYGITLEKDPYEPFATQVITPLGQRTNLPYDFFSLHFAYRTSRGHQWLIGDYRLQSGQGLILGTTAFGTKYQRMLQSYSAKILRPYRSSGEADYYRGLAFQLQLPWKQLAQRLSLLAFASWRDIDAHTKGDSLLTFYTTGLHRNITELSHRRTANVWVAGGKLSYNAPRWQAGLTGYYAHYSHHVAPALRDYNRYSLRGQTAGGMALDGSAKIGRHWAWQGEVAMDAGGHCAFSQALRYVASPATDAFHFFLQHRSVSPRFVAPFGHAPMNNNQVANEHGLLLGVAITPWPRATLTAYIDGAYHPEARYRALPQSKALETFAELRWKNRHNSYYLLSYKIKTKEETLTERLQMEFRTTHRISAQYFLTTSKFSLVPTLRATLYHAQTQPAQWGYMASLRVSHHPSPRWQWTGYIAYFSSKHHTTRLYAYEPQLLGTMTFPVYNHQGTRWVVQGQWELCQGLFLSARYACLKLFDQSTIGSGLQTIASAWQHDISAQLRWKF